MHYSNCFHLLIHLNLTTTLQTGEDEKSEVRDVKLLTQGHSG